MLIHPLLRLDDEHDSLVHHSIQPPSHGRPLMDDETYLLHHQLPNQRKSKSLALKTINEKVETHGSSDEDVVEKDVAYLAKNFRKFLKFKNSEKFGDKGKFMSSRKEKKDFEKKEGKESQST